MSRYGCAFLLILLLAAPAVRAQDDPAVNRPETAGRIVRAFDFEERRTNPFPIPRFWQRAQDEPHPDDPQTRRIREGYPLWNQAYLDYTFAFAGEGSLCLPTGGGSTALRLDSGVLPIFPDTEYLISAKVRTHQLRHARARISAWFLDRHNQRIPDSIVRSDLLVADGRWRTVVLTVPGGASDAAYIQLELELLQPARFSDPALGRHQVWEEDFKGAAWFDDVTIAQLPRVILTTGAPANIVAHPARPVVRRLVRDLTGEQISARVTVYDVEGRVVERIAEPVMPGEGWRNWEPTLPGFGWYRATLDVLSAQQRVGSAYVDFVYVPPAPAGRGFDPERARFGAILESIDPPLRTELRELVRLAGLGAVTIPIWDDGLTAELAPKRVLELVPVVSGLLADGRSVTFSLPRVPSMLAASTRVPADDPLAVFAHADDAWASVLLPYLDKFGQSVQRWQVGRVSDLRPRGRSDMAPTLTGFRHGLSRLVPGPAISIPWPADLHADLALFSGVLPDAMVLSVPCALLPSAMPGLAESWRGFAGTGPRAPRITALVRTLPQGQFSGLDTCVDLLKRSIALAAAFDPDVGEDVPPALLIEQPWTVAGLRRPQVLPRPELAAWRTLADRLSGRRIVGEFPVSPGVKCFILAPAPLAPAGRTGALVAWLDPGGTGNGAIDAYLGEGPVTAVDLFGNESAVAQRTENARDPSTAPHYLPLGDAPVFLENVDVELARFAASFHLEPGFARTSVVHNEHEILLSNPWPYAIEGRLVVVEPGGYADEAGQRDRSWKIAPRAMRFAIGAGDTVRLPISISFSPLEEAGPKDFIAEVQLESGRATGTLRLRAPLEIGLDTIRLDVAYRFGPTPTGPDLLVEAIIGNQSAAPSTFEVSAFPPPGSGLARAKASVSDLPAGESTIRRFSFRGAAAALRGQRITIGVQDITTDARINRSVVIE